MMVYFHNGKEEGHIMAAAEPSANDVAAINTPPFVIDFNAYVWAIDEAVKRGLFKWAGKYDLVVADTYDRAAAFDPF